MNKPLQNELWENIRNFAFDDPASDFPFSKKLQKENNWSSVFTAGAIEEYRRFIFLCCILPNGASPSETVDKVWHLHLTYTTNYWIEFCRKTLHKDIHHYPAKGGSDEQLKHANWYRQTLEKYLEVFGSNPPVSIWPPAQLISEQIKIEIYDKDFFKKTILLFIVCIVLYVSLLNIFGSKGQDFLVYYFILMVAGITVSWILQQHKSKKLDEFIDQHFPSKFSPYQIAFFLYGKHRAYQTALINLLKRDMIEVSGNDYKLNAMPLYDSANEDNPLLPAITENMDTGNIFSYQKGLLLMDTAKLQHPSFNQLTSLAKKVDFRKLIVPGIVWAIGIARLFQGMANERPVNYLVFEIGLFSLVSLMVAAQYSYTYLVYKKSAAIWMNQNNNGYGNDVINNFTLIGATAIAGFAEYPVLSKVFDMEAPAKRTDSDGGLAVSSCSSGGDSGCSGGDGGGCGGCGGGD